MHAEFSNLQEAWVVQLVQSKRPSSRSTTECCLAEQKYMQIHLTFTITKCRKKGHAYLLCYHKHVNGFLKLVVLLEKLRALDKQLWVSIFIQITSHALQCRKLLGTETQIQCLSYCSTLHSETKRYNSAMRSLKLNSNSPAQAHLKDPLREEAQSPAYSWHMYMANSKPTHGTCTVFDGA